jgi:RND family efflux transporter MFP subunit
MKKRYILLSVLLFLFACAGEKEKLDEKNIKQTYERKLPVVDWQLLTLSDWNAQLLSQGKLQAWHKAEMRFKIGGLLQNLAVSNGEHVKKGQLLAQLDDEELQNSYHLAQTEWQKAKTERYIQLIERAPGSDTLLISADKKAVVDLRTGYASAQVQLEQAGYNLRQTKLFAPFEGKIANLLIQNHNFINTSDIFCLVVDDAQFYLDFTILESETRYVKVGQHVMANAMMLKDKQYEAKITEINPVVDANGMVSVRAQLKGNAALFDGMQMEISTGEVLKNQMVVPKQAVVDRSGKWVVFVAQGGMAKWKYVDIDGENAGFYRIVNGLDAGDTIILSNNFNLVHDSEIKLKE